MRTKSEVERDITEVQKDIKEAKLDMRTHQSQIEDLGEEVSNLEQELRDLDQELQAIERARPMLYIGNVVEMEQKRYMVYVDGGKPYSYQLLLLKGGSSYFIAGCWNSHTWKRFERTEQLSDYVYDHGGVCLGKFCDLYEEKN